MDPPGKIKKLDEVVVNRIAAGEVIQRPANALKELIENSLDAKATNIQIVTKEGGLKLLQIQDNGTGIRKEDMEIVCERFTTSKLQQFEDLRSISTFGFRGEALASISHVALLTITTKTANEKCAYKASYVDSKLKGPPKPCAGNQGTTITIENLFYNVATRRKALSSPSEEFSKISDVVTRYAVHNPTVGFTLKKHGETTPQIRTPHNSTKMNNVRILYGNPVSRELLEIENDDEAYKFKMHALITNPNYSNKRMVFLLFINHRLVDSSSMRKMLEDLYNIYLPKKTHPWCYISLHINPQNLDVNVHPTKHEVRFLHEDSIIEKIKSALDEKLAGNNASRTFYLQARLPKASITEEALEEVLPEYDKESSDKSKKVNARELIRTDSNDQKLDKFNFTKNAFVKNSKSNDDTNINKKSSLRKETIDRDDNNTSVNKCLDNEDTDEESFVEVNSTRDNKSSNANEATISKSATHWSSIIDESTPSSSKFALDSALITSTQNDKPMDTNKESIYDINDILEITRDEGDLNASDIKEKCVDEIADKARQRVYKYFGSKDMIEGGKKVVSETYENIEDTNKNSDDKTEGNDNTENSNNKTAENNDNKETGDQIKNAEDNTITGKQTDSTKLEKENSNQEFKSYSVNSFRREVRLTSILKLRKEIEDSYHEGLRRILSELTFIGCVDQKSSLIQSGVNLYICDTEKLAEELFYEIMLYDFANYGVIKFSDPISLFDLAMLGLETEEAGWTEEDGDKKELAMNVKELLLEKADMMKEYFSIVIDKKGNLKSLPILLDKYFPYEAGLPLYMLRLATEVEWSAEQPCFRNICRETAKYYSQMNPMHDDHDWKYITEHVLYPAMKESLLPPKHFAHDSTILQIANLPNLYKVFERC